jgi:hypothetical protein
VDERRVLNGIFWVLQAHRSEESCRGVRAADDLLQPLRAVRKARVSDRIMAAVNQVYDGDVRRSTTFRRASIGTPPTQKIHPRRCMGRSCGGLTTKDHALTDCAPSCRSSWS